MTNKKTLGLRLIGNERYDMFIALLKGEFKVPVRDRASAHKRILMQFYRNKKYLQLRKVKNIECTLLRKTTVKEGRI